MNVPGLCARCHREGQKAAVRSTGLQHEILTNYTESIHGTLLKNGLTVSNSELTAKFREWSPTLWTWSSAPDAFPMGWRPFIQLVNHGVDLTLGNAAVEQLVRDVKPFNECATLPILPQP